MPLAGALVKRKGRRQCQGKNSSLLDICRIKDNNDIYSKVDELVKSQISFPSLAWERNYGPSLAWATPRATDNLLVLLAKLSFASTWVPKLSLGTR
jgi:hypothetical protein